MVISRLEITKTPHYHFISILIHLEENVQKFGEVQTGCVCDCVCMTVCYWEIFVGYTHVVEFWAAYISNMQCNKLEVSWRYFPLLCVMVCQRWSCLSNLFLSLACILDLWFTLRRWTQSCARFAWRSIDIRRAYIYMIIYLFISDDADVNHQCWKLYVQGNTLV